MVLNDDHIIVACYLRGSFKYGMVMDVQKHGICLSHCFCVCFTYPL